MVIGAVHFPPLLGYPNSPGLTTALQLAKRDIRTFVDGGANAIIIENNYDLPHFEKVPVGSSTSLTYLAAEIRKTFPKTFLGISVLWNDYHCALSIAKICHLNFIRVPVFVDTVKTSCGIIQGSPDDVIRYRRKIKAENVQLFTDIHVKHSILLSKYSLQQSARLAKKKGSDAIIVTGNWTGDAPQTSNLALVRNTVGDFPILAGSGVNSENINSIFRLANGAIVSTSLKNGAINRQLTNLTDWHQRIASSKVKKLTQKI